MSGGRQFLSEATSMIVSGGSFEHLQVFYSGHSDA